MRTPSLRPLHRFTATNPFPVLLGCVVVCLQLIGPAAAPLRAAEPGAPRRASKKSAAVPPQPQAFVDPFDTATPQSEKRPRIADPLEPANRAFFKFNDKLYFWFLKPVATGYRTILPEPARVSVRKFFTNLKTPGRLANCLFQGKFKAAGTETARFVINSTVGLVGFFDPAKSKLHLQLHNEDFDQTLGFYGVGQGAYLNWPILGPSSVRGTFGLVGDALLDPVFYLDIPFAAIAGANVYSRINLTSLHLGEYENFKKNSLDPYLALRSAYVQERAALVKE